MTIPVIQSLVAKNGKYIVMPVWISGQTKWGNLAHPNPHANSSVGDTAQQYPIGTKFVDGERTFYYGLVDTVQNTERALYGMFNMNEQDTVDFGVTAGVAGDTIVGVVASSMEVDTTPVEDFFAGGWFLARTHPRSSYRVLASTTYTGGRTNGEVDLTLDYGLIEAVTAGQTSNFLNRNEFTKVRQYISGYNYCTVVGVSLISSVAATYQWFQTWGPCYVVPYNEEIGESPHRHQAVFHTDGTLRLSTGTDQEDRQIAGYMYPSSGTTALSTWLIRLQLNQ